MICQRAEKPFRCQTCESLPAVIRVSLKVCNHWETRGVDWCGIDLGKLMLSYASDVWIDNRSSPHPNIPNLAIRGNFMTIHHPILVCQAPRHIVIFRGLSQPSTGLGKYSLTCTRITLPDHAFFDHVNQSDNILCSGTKIKLSQYISLPFRGSTPFVISPEFTGNLRPTDNRTIKSLNPRNKSKLSL